MFRTVLGLLAFCLVVRALREPFYEEKTTKAPEKRYVEQKTIVMCQGKGIDPCTCYASGPKIDCRGSLDSAHFNDMPRSNFVTPSESFYPREVDLSRNGINLFKADFFLTKEQRRHVEVLDLSQNDIKSSYDLYLDEFKNLRVLNLSNNNFQFWTTNDGFFGEVGFINGERTTYTWKSDNLFETLEVLDLSNNQINTFPNKFFSKFKKLKRVILDNNPIRRLQNAGYRANTIEELSLNACQMQEFERETLKSVPFLKKLWIRDNYLSGYLIQIIRELDSLTFLDASNNQYDRVSWDSYPVRKFPLETLLLGGNKIHTIQRREFKQFHDLKTLDLSHNYLDSIDPEAFGAPYDYGYNDALKLQELNLEDNLLRSLPKDFVSWQHVKKLNLKNNRLMCDTNLKWLISDKTIPIDKSVSCFEPAYLKGQKLHDVKEQDLQNPIENSILYYLRQALDWLTQDQPLFYFGLGALVACLVMLALRCCYCCLCCCIRRTDRKIIKLKEDYDRQKLLKYQAMQPKPQEEDTQTIVETIPDV